MRKRFESVWAIRPEATLTVVRLMSREMAASDSPHATSTADGKSVMLGTKWEAAGPTMRGSGGNKVAVVPIQGVLTNDGPSYYGSSYRTIADAVEKAAADPDVKRIVLSVDSPGGEVTGLPETAAVIAAAAKRKPVSAIVEGAAASAAYWLTSQASDITLTPSGEVGSVGVRMMHVDMSKMLEKDGITVTELHSGDFKTEWSPYAPLSGDAKADMQARLADSHKQFLQAIANGRGSRASRDVTAKRYGEGRMFSSGAALKAGLVDKVQSSRDFYSGSAGIPAQVQAFAGSTVPALATRRA
ncbi:MAG: S49 family peptidase, partial [Janthinobacterium lividum]